MSPVVVTVGEAMLRLSPPRGRRLESSEVYEVYAGGSEANVAATLAGLGVATAWLSALPEGPLGRRVAAALRAHGVHVGGVVWVPDARLGLYFYEPGGSPGPGRLLYDRAGSAFARLDPGLFDWSLLHGARFLHLSGITAAIHPQLARVAVAAAQRAGVAVSLDVNHRARLWSPEAARAALEPLAAGADLLLCSRADAAALFGTAGEAAEVASALARRLGVTRAAVTDGGQGAALYTPDGVEWQPAWPATVADRLGAGDAFAAGLLFGLVAETPPAGPLSCGLALAAWKLGQVGDIAWCDRESLASFVRSRGGGPWR